MSDLYSHYDFTVPDQKKIRVIIDTDAKNEADDQYAIVHALLTQKIILKGIIAAHFGMQRTPNSMQESYSEIRRIIELMNLYNKVTVVHGGRNALDAEDSPVPSEGSELIIKEAMTGDQRPLYCLFLGPLTDMACALRMCPEIEDKLIVIWIGGGKWPSGGEEYNLRNDVIAANVVFKSKVQLWQVPQNVYSMIRVCLSELQGKVKPYGDIGQYLFTQMVEFNDLSGKNAAWPSGESWVLGDSAAVGLLLDQHENCYEWIPAPYVDKDMHYIHGRNNRPIRVYSSVDARFILEDFFTKLKICFSHY